MGGTNIIGWMGIISTDTSTFSVLDALLCANK